MPAGDACGMPAGDACGMPAVCRHPARDACGLRRHPPAGIHFLSTCQQNQENAWMPAEEKALQGSKSFYSGRHPGILSKMLAGASKMDACRRMPAHPAGIRWRMPAGLQASRRHPAGIPQASRRHPLQDACRPAGIPQRTPVAKDRKQKMCPGVGDEHRCVSERWEHAAVQRWPRESPEAGGWVGGKEKGAPPARACSSISLRCGRHAPGSSPRAVGGWERGGWAAKPRQYYFVRRPVVRRSFNAEREGRPVPPSALKEALWTGILTKKY